MEPKKAALYLVDNNTEGIYLVSQTIGENVYALVERVLAKRVGWHDLATMERLVLHELLYSAAHYAGGIRWLRITTKRPAAECPLVTLNVSKRTVSFNCARSTCTRALAQLRFRDVCSSGLTTLMNASCATWRGSSRR